jgi:hypothetical protein
LMQKEALHFVLLHSSVGWNNMVVVADPSMQAFGGIGRVLRGVE